MHHIKLIIFGTVLVIVVVFGFIFWDDLKFNQQQISNMPLPPSPAADLQQGGSMNYNQSTAESDDAPPLNSEDDLDSLESDLNNTNLEIDSDRGQIETELQGL
jgi:hypothetical protein